MFEVEYRLPAPVTPGVRVVNGVRPARNQVFDRVDRFEAIVEPGEALRDFVVREESDAGFPSFVNLIGIESPGLTAAPAIAERVVELLSGL